MKAILNNLAFYTGYLILITQGGYLMFILITVFARLITNFEHLNFKEIDQIASTVFVIIYLIAAMLANYFFFRFIRNIHRAEIFTHLNVVLLKKFAVTVVIASIAGVIQKVVYLLWMYVPGAMNEPNFLHPVNIIILFSAVIALIFREVIKRGMIYKNEIELTV